MVFSPAALEQQLMENGFLCTFLLNNFFETVNVPIRSHKAIHTPADDNQKNDFCGIDWAIEATEPQTLDR